MHVKFWKESCTQVALSKHGFESHGSSSTPHTSPVNPAGQRHMNWSKSSVTHEALLRQGSKRTQGSNST